MATKRIIRISYFTMLTIVGALLRFPVLGTVVYFSMQSLFVIMSGLLLGARDGAFSQIAYTVLGLIGLPIFTKGGGFWYIFEPSFGYIIGFILGSFVCGLVKSRFKTLSILKLFLCALAGLGVLYLVGISYQIIILCQLLGYSLPAALSTLIYLPVLFVIDAVMLYLVCLIYPRLNTMIGLSTPAEIKDNGLKKNKSTNTANISNDDK